VQISTDQMPVTPVTPGSTGSVLVGLTRREREVLVELARGRSYSAMATALFVSENTVKTHVSSVYRKLGVDRRIDALRVAREQQLL
jgi:LuxR family maltose regulon positive regulatory protein